MYFGRMTLNEYILSVPKEDRYALRKAIANDLGVSEITVRSWANGNRKPGAFQVNSIVGCEFISGNVSAFDLRPDVFLPSQ